MGNKLLEFSNCKISIIIPIYKVEQFLRKCIDSVIKQTYSNLEIILVDDGSPDNCPSICDEYACSDNRIRVIHKKNGGLSEARNCGLDIATGDYIGFVDSDDWVESDMFEVLHRNAIMLKADITICGYYIVKENKIKIPYVLQTDMVYSQEEALKELIHDTKVKNYTWNKLYRKELFAQIRYPVGAKFEDMATTYKLFAKSEKIVLINEYKYYYLFRKEGISNQKTLDNSYDLFKAYQNRYNDLKEVIPQYKNQMYKQLISSALAFYNKCLIVKISGEDEPRIEEIVTFINEHSMNKAVNILGNFERFSLKLIGQQRKIYNSMYLVYVILRNILLRSTSISRRE